MKKHDIINECQYGFLQGRTTAMAITDLVQLITDAIVKKMSTIGVFIDKKEFDTINQKILVKRLENCGICGIASKWVYSYLTNCIIHY